MAMHTLSPAMSVPLDFLKDQRVLVVGMGLSGLATAKAIQKSGAHVTVTDDRHTNGEGFAYQPPDQIDPKGFDLILLSPGIAHKGPHPHPLVVKALKAGTPLSSDMDLFFQTRPPVTTIGISGTNGKSSTTSLIHCALSALGQHSVMAGNIGVPILTVLPLEGKDVCVIELSSYQLETVPHLSLDLAILLAITPDHLARHGTLEAYAAQKRTLFNIGAEKGRCLYDAQDPWQAPFVHKAPHPHRFIPYALGVPLKAGFFLIEETLHDTYHTPHTIVEASCPHMAETTLLTSFAALRLLGYDAHKIIEAIKAWPGLAHRYERVIPAQHPSANITFINDSKATNVEAAAFALKKSQGQPLFWIVGGRLKDQADLTPWTPYLPFVTEAFPMGESAATVARFLADHHVRHTPCSTLASAYQEAVAAAARWAQNNPGKRPPLVLLSPGGASFDAFPHFEARGDHFKALIQSDKMIKTL